MYSLAWSENINYIFVQSAKFSGIILAYDIDN